MESQQSCYKKRSSSLDVNIWSYLTLKSISFIKNTIIKYVILVLVTFFINLKAYRCNTKIDLRTDSQLKLLKRIKKSSKNLVFVFHKNKTVWISGFLLVLEPLAWPVTRAETGIFKSLTRKPALNRNPGLLSKPEVH